MMPGGMSQGEGSANNQTGALGMNSLQIGPVGSPTMNRMETGGDPGLAERDREREREAGVTGNSQAGAAMHASAQNAAATSSTTPATATVTSTAPVQNLVGQAGNSVAFGQHILQPGQNSLGSYGPMRGSLMDPRNYGMNQGFLGNQGFACGGGSACQGCQGQGCQGQGCQGQGCQGLGCQGLGCQGQGCQGYRRCTCNVQQKGICQQ